MTKHLTVPPKTQAEIHKLETRGEGSALWEISQEEEMGKKKKKNHRHLSINTHTEGREGQGMSDREEKTNRGFRK